MMKKALRSFWQFIMDSVFKTVQWEADRCSGCLTCYQICPVGCCRPDQAAGKIHPPDQERCVTCGACVLQCPEEALKLERRG